MVSSDRALVLFTKPARPGRVKTRLIGGAAGELTAEEAAALHWALVLDQLGRLEGGDFDLSIAWAIEDGETAPELGFSALLQSGTTLGERLYRGLAEVASEAHFIAAVGSDHPQLTLAVVEEGFRRLDDGTDLILGPAADGGYYLIGLRAERLSPRLFADIPWSTGQVLTATLERGRELGLAVDLLDEGHDVDRPADLARLARSLSMNEGGCPRTHALLESWGLVS